MGAALKLYELPRLWDDIKIAIAQTDGEMPPMVEAMLDQFDATLAEKVDGI